MQTISLSWKSFNVNLDMVEAQAKSIDSSCCGMTAIPDVPATEDKELIPGRLDVHFTDNAMGQDKVDSLNEYWDAITLASAEATSYQTDDQIKAAAAAKEASDLAAAITILKGLGLSDDQIAALRG